MKINIFQEFICGCVLKHDHSLSTQPESRESCLGLCQHSESQRNYSNAFPAGVHWQVRQRCALGVGTASRIGMLIPNVGITKQILCCQWPHVDFISLVRKACSKKKQNMPGSGVLKSAIAMCVGTGKEETCSGAGMQLSLLAYLFSPAVGYVDLVHVCEKTTSSLK